MLSLLIKLIFSITILFISQAANGQAGDAEQIQQIKTFFNGQAIQTTYREGGPIYGTYYIYETHFCTSGRYYANIYSERQTVLDNQQINQWQDQGEWDVISYGGRVGLGFRSMSGEENFIPVQIRADGALSFGEGVTVTKMGGARC